MRIYGVKLPIGGHAYLEIEAEDEDGAIAKALEKVTREHIEEWDVLERVNRGNVCYFPQPWEPEATDMGEPEPDL